MATETLRPNAAGSETNIPSQYPDSTLHWDKVDEVEADEASTYVYKSGAPAWTRDLYALPASSGSGAINKITLYFRIRVDPMSYEVGRAKGAIKTNNTVYETAEKSPSSWETFSEEWAQNPSNAHAWTWDEIDALEIGINLHPDSVGYSTECTQVYVVVDYIGVTYEELSGLSAGVASMSGSIVRKRPLSGLSAGICSVSGFTRVKRALAGLSQGIASVSGFIAVKRALVGISSGIASISGSIQKLKELSGASAGIALVSGSLSRIRVLAGISASVSSVSGFIRISIELSGLSAGVATVSGSLSRIRLAIRNLLAVRNISPVRILDKLR